MVSITFSNVPVEAVEALAATASVLYDENGEVVSETAGEKAKRHIIEYVKRVTRNYEREVTVRNFQRDYVDKEVS